MELRPINPDAPEDFARFFAALDAADRAGRPEAPRWDRRRLEIQLRHTDPSERTEAAAARIGGELIGGWVWTRPLRDNTSLCWGMPFVVPAHRGRGHGSRLVESLVGRAREHGRTRLLAMAQVPPERLADHPVRRFAAAHGFTLGSVEVARRLDLPVAPEQLERLEAQARPHHE